MKKLNQIMLASALLVALFFVGCLKDDNDMESKIGDLTQQGLQAQPAQGEEAHVISYSSNVIPGQYIVVYKQGALASGRSLEGKKYAEIQQVMKEESALTLRRNRIPTEKVEFVYGKTIQGFSVKNLTDQELELLRQDEQIAYIEQDQIASVNMGGPPGGGGGGGGGDQSTPWGVTRVGGAIDGSTAGTAWIIDSGVDLDHPDLNVDVTRSETFLGGNSTPDDQNGHGTHVAGTVGAIDNGYGVVGVAAGATIVAVRVLDRRGSGAYSGVIAGVEYVGANGSSGDAANMSLGGGFSQAMNDAVEAAAGPGGCNCAFALAAGNESTSATTKSPASAEGSNIYTVSAMNSSDNWASFSNYGNPPVDYCAPGVSIPSCWKDGGYNTISGTSMASPHVCGILLIGGITTDGTVSGDPDGNPDPIAHH